MVILRCWPGRAGVDRTTMSSLSLRSNHWRAPPSRTLDLQIAGIQVQGIQAVDAALIVNGLLARDALSGQIRRDRHLVLLHGVTARKLGRREPAATCAT